MVDIIQGFSCGSADKEATCNAGDLVWEDPLEKGMATHSSILENSTDCTLPAPGPWDLSLPGEALSSEVAVGSVDPVINRSLPGARTHRQSQLSLRHDGSR